MKKTNMFFHPQPSCPFSIRNKSFKLADDDRFIKLCAVILRVAQGFRWSLKEAAWLQNGDAILQPFCF
jgi:hypothetical protein